ncbi:Gti1/Pac2 family-domain-containing protein, partial [Amylocystis lapponica]
MQQPTLQNVRIRSTRDALQIFYAVARNVLPMTTRRLDAEERRAIMSGNVYIWEERCANSEATGMGMERWTDGMGWGPSRVRDDFLFYHQRESELQEDPTHPSARWANMMRRRESRPGNPSFSRSENERLIKQTYSVHVSLPEDRPRGVTRKWHLTAYFSQPTLDNLGTIDNIPDVGNAQVPDGWFRSARASKAKRSEANSGDEVSPAPDQWGLGTQTSTSQGLSQFPVDSADAPHGTQPHHSSPGPYAVHPSQHRPALDRYPPPAPSGGHSSQELAPPLAYPPRLPTLADSGLRHYRDASPYTHSSSSSSSDPAYSPRPFSSPLTPPHVASPPFATNPALGPRDLVPLTYLQNLAGPLRDPLDEQFLRRFSTSQI